MSLEKIEIPKAIIGDYEKMSAWMQTPEGKIHYAGIQEQMREDEARERREWEEKNNAERIKNRLVVFQIPRRILANASALDETKAMQRAREWAAMDESMWCLVLSAGKGVGKSTAAGWWLRERARAKDAGSSKMRRWWTAPELAAVDYYGSEIREIIDLPEMVIDDLGVEFNDVKGAFQSKLDRILDGRYREYRKTIITTNLDVEAFKKRYDTRVYDRLREGAVWVSISDQSLRGQKAGAA